MIKNLYELYNLIEKVSTALPNVNQFVNSFDSLNREDTSYAAVVLQFRDGTQVTEGTVRYRFYLGYVDRVNENTDTPSTSNNILTQSIAEENIRLIINKLYPEVDITFGNTFYPFTQRFTSLTAGCYVELAITLAVKDCNYESGSVLRDVEIVSDSNGVKEVVPGAGVDGFKKVIVRTEVPPIIYADVDGMKYAYSTIEEFPSYFKFAPRLKDDCKDMFAHCLNLTSIPQLDTRGVRYMDRMFQDCLSLVSIPQLNTSKVEWMSEMFAGCISLTSIPKLDATSLTIATRMFEEGFGGGLPLTNFGGLTNLKIDLDLSTCPNLTKESLLNVFNEAADVTSSPKTLTLGTTNLNKLTDEEKAIATNKGWTLA